MKALGLLLVMTGLMLSSASAGTHNTVIPSPDHHFEVYFPAPPDFGFRLYLRPYGLKSGGRLFLSNDRYMEMKWSPNSAFLGVEDHWDGHSCDIYVYEPTLNANKSEAIPKLIYHSPNLGQYDVQWTIAGWDVRNRTILLRRDETYEGQKPPTTTKVRQKLETTEIPTPPHSDADPKLLR